MTRTLQDDSSPPRELRCTVVICCYTPARWPLTLQALESVRRQTHKPAQLVLVVDHCEQLLQRAREELTGVSVVPNTEEPGLSGARNSGVAASTGEVVAFLDDDATADPGWLAALARLYAAPDVMGAGGMVRPVWDGGRPAWYPPEFEWVVGCSPMGLPGAVGPVRNFTGANMSFRRAVLQAVGGFRADLGRVGTRPVGCEETELCLRARAMFPAGALLHQPDAQVRHHVPAERATFTYFRRRCYAEGLSKAVVSRYAGVDAALASERRYVRGAIPRGLRDAALARRPARAAALVAGTALAVAGYGTGRWRARQRGSGPTGAAMPQATSLGSAVPDGEPAHAGWEVIR